MFKQRLISTAVYFLMWLTAVQAAHWECNIHAFQYDMTVYATLQLNGTTVTNPDAYEIAAFCGDECRGVASIETISGTDISFYYLRVHSNTTTGETITFKCYDTTTKEEVPINENLEFTSQAVTGYPSQPFFLTGKAKTYKVTYMLDGEEFFVGEYIFGAEITTPEAPEKEGHTFNGWSDVPETMPAEDITIYGSYTVNSYDVVYIVDGEEYKRVQVAYGEDIPEEATPEKEGHTFSGWSETPATMPAGDVTVTGSFTVNTYKVTFVIDGEEFQVANVTFGAEITTPEAPGKEGHTFAGWADVPETMPAEDITIYGSYTVNSYDVVYIVDGEEYKRVQVAYGEDIPEEATPEKEGHTFSGWSETPATMPAGDVTVTGSFTVNTYKVTFVIDGEVYITIDVKYGEAIEPEDVPEKEGYVFSGWEGIPETMPAHDIEVHGSFVAVGLNNVYFDTFVNVYNLKGQIVGSHLRVRELKQILKRGIYIINGKKFFIE